MHANCLPSADPCWFQVWLRWKRNRKVSKSRANSRQFGCLSIASRGRCQQHTCRVRAHQQGGHMVQINHLMFMGGAGAGLSPWLWLWKTAQLLRDVLGLDELPHCCLVVKAQQKTSLPLSAFSAGLRFGATTFIGNVDLIGLEGRNFTLQGQSNLYNL